MLEPPCLCIINMTSIMLILCPNLMQNPHEAKMAFEIICYSYGVRFLHYHVYNFMFDTKKFKEACNTAKQTLSFYGINAHNQNGKDENIIKDVTTGARTDLLHSYHHWPNAIHASLWTSAIKNCSNLRNSIPANFKPKTYHRRNKIPYSCDSFPLSALSGPKVESNLDHFHPFGSPVYVLENSLQSSKSHNKCIDISINCLSSPSVFVVCFNSYHSVLCQCQPYLVLGIK